MARAARLSGVGLEDDDFEEIEELIQEKNDHPEELVYPEISTIGKFQMLYMYTENTKQYENAKCLKCI